MMSALQRCVICSINYDVGKVGDRFFDNLFNSSLMERVLKRKLHLDLVSTGCEQSSLTAVSTYVRVHIC